MGRSCEADRGRRPGQPGPHRDVMGDMGRTLRSAVAGTMAAAAMIALSCGSALAATPTRP